MRHLTLDFEIRSQISIKDVGPYRYYEHPSTHPLMCGFKQGDREVLIYNLHWFRLPDWVRDAIEDDDVELHAHNAATERLCIKMLMSKRYGWPIPLGRRWRCSAARARRLALPGKLEKLGPALNLRDADLKDAEGHKIMLRITRPLPKRKGSPVGFQYDDDPAKLERVGEYCLQDVIAEEMAERQMLPMTDRELDYYAFTERMNDRGCRIDVGLVRRLVWRAVEAADELNKEMAERTGGAVQKATNVAQLKQWVYDETGQVLDTLRKEDWPYLLDEANSRNFPKHVIRVLRLRQEGAKSSNSKLLKMLARVSNDGRLRGEFVYHGASTGRYTSMGVQLQNLIRDTLEAKIKAGKLPWKDWAEAIEHLDEFTLDQITLAIRGCFIPADGCVFVDADYNAIEARGVAWLAGAKSLVRKFRDGVDTYCDMGSVIFRFTVTEENEWERFVGKQTILGCGYGMGAQKFYDQCVKFGTPVPMETAERAVKAYREEYPEIPKLWRAMEAAAIAAVKEPGRVFEIPNGLISFRVAHGYLQMMLPDGTRLFYKDPHIIRRKKFDKMQDVLHFMGIHPKTKQWMRESTWGGTLTENAVQAIARNILFAAMLRMDRKGIPLVLSVHDQITAEVPIEDGQWTMKTVKFVMEDLSDCYSGFPVKVKPQILQRFGK